MQHFHMVCGTSTGGLISLGYLTGKSLEDAENMYLTLGSKIFTYHFGQYTKYAMSIFGSESDYYVLDKLQKV